MSNWRASKFGGMESVRQPAVWKYATNGRSVREILSGYKLRIHLELRPHCLPAFYNQITVSGIFFAKRRTGSGQATDRKILGWFVIYFCLI